MVWIVTNCSGSKGSQRLQLRQASLVDPTAPVEEHTVQLGCDSPQMSRMDVMKAAVHECVSSCTVMYAMGMTRTPNTAQS